MKYGIYSIRDKLVGFGALTLSNSDESAIRNFAYACRSGISDFASSDFTLYHVGNFDLEFGVIETLPVPRAVIDGNNAKHYLEVD